MDEDDPAIRFCQNARERPLKGWDKTCFDGFIVHKLDLNCLEIRGTWAGAKYRRFPFFAHFLDKMKVH